MTEIDGISEIYIVIKLSQIMTLINATPFYFFARIFA